MHIILWEYQVTAEKRTEFIKTYAPNGTWAELFRKAEGYLGTELMQSENQPERFLTADRWVSKESFEAFKTQWNEKYKALDIQCEGLTKAETLLGTWESI